MNKFLISALSVLLFGFNFAIPASAHCGMCDEDQASESSKADLAKKHTAQAGEKKSLEGRVSDLEKSVKDVGCADTDAGSPYSSKSKTSTKSKSQCCKAKSS
jgi:hypothetical protein